jgi:hypothetical protein
MLFVHVSISHYFLINKKIPTLSSGDFFKNTLGLVAACFDATSCVATYMHNTV